MTLISIVVALLIEQARPLAVARVDAWLKAWADQLETRFNAGERRHGVAAWLIGAALPSLLLLGAYALAVWSNWLLAVLIGVGVLYLTIGFRQFSHYFTDIHLALRMGELDQARQLLGEWRGTSAERLGSNEICPSGHRRGAAGLAPPCLRAAVLVCRARSGRRLAVSVGPPLLLRLGQRRSGRAANLASSASFRAVPLPPSTGCPSG